MFSPCYPSSSRTFPWVSVDLVVETFIIVTVPPFTHCFFLLLFKLTLSFPFAPFTFPSDAHYGPILSSSSLTLFHVFSILLHHLFSCPPSFLIYLALSPTLFSLLRITPLSTYTLYQYFVVPCHVFSFVALTVSSFVSSVKRFPRSFFPYLRLPSLLLFVHFSLFQIYSPFSPSRPLSGPAILAP